ncbi:MAG: hypothetical protein AB1898_30570 [Acidobacteriota bacterium]
MKWRWEFRRRDPEYKAAWREVQELRKTGKQSGPAERRLALQFELYRAELLDPGKSFDELCEGKDHRWVTETFIDPQYDKALKIIGTWQPAVLIPGALFKWAFLIDFTKVNSITQLKKDVTRWIGECWSLTQKKSPETRTTQKMKDFGRILKVGELRGEHKTYRQIMDEVGYPDCKDAESAEQRAKQDYRLYRELTVGGGWRHLSYP